MRRSRLPSRSKHSGRSPGSYQTPTQAGVLSIGCERFALRDGPSYGPCGREGHVVPRTVLASGSEVRGEEDVRELGPGAQVDGAEVYHVQESSAPFDV